jgi:S-adenosylmethionine:tRNA ribosyltransferase-isomerase
VTVAALDFDLPFELAAREPAEARGLRRDQVRLLVTRAGRAPTHHVFADLPSLLEPGDLVVINNSATIPAALDARLDSARPIQVHVSSVQEDGTWLVELRRNLAPFPGGRAGQVLDVPGSVMVLLRPYTERLWVATAPGPLIEYTARHGRPIRYDYTDRDWPLSTYQNIFSTEPGSAEMPSAGRPFTGEVLAGLAARGITVAPVTLHTGVASPEAGEPPYPERFVVPAATARLVEHTRANGGRVVAVGTTVVRALESAPGGGSGWTDLVITPDRGVSVVGGLLTGLHEPRASHLAMLAAVGGEAMLRDGYAAALAEKYLWHEFGDVHLLLPSIH